MLNMPKTLETRNVMLDSFTSNISNAPKEFSRTSKMIELKKNGLSLRKMEKILRIGRGAIANNLKKVEIS